MPSSSLSAQSAVTLLNVSYDPTRELYQDVNAAFAAAWKAKSGQTVTINQSHGGSGKQARAVIDGLPADVVTLALAYDVDAHQRARPLLAQDWQARLPSNSAPYTSTIVLLVRRATRSRSRTGAIWRGPASRLMTPNPKTSGGARWNYLAAWGYALKKWNGDEAKARDFVARVYQQRAGARFRGARLDDHVRAARHRRRAVAWENEALLALKKLGADKFELVIPSLTILAEPPVALVDKVVDRRGTRKVAQAYLDFLYSPEGQEIAARHYYRPRLEAVRRSTRPPSATSRRSPSMNSSAAGRRRRRRTLPMAASSIRSISRGLGAQVTYTLARRRTLPGFGLTLGLTVFYLSLLVLIPLSGLLVKAASLSWTQVVAGRHGAARAGGVPPHDRRRGRGRDHQHGVRRAAGVAAGAPSLPGQRIADAMVDLPFALPTAVAGIALTTVYSVNGWLGQYFERAGVPIAFTPLGIVVALTFVGLPFVVRTVEPVLQDLDPEMEEAAASLGATRAADLPARDRCRRCSRPLLTGFTLAFARALGEYGSVVFISGNLPMRTEIITLLIMAKLEQYDYTGAAALAVVMLISRSRCWLRSTCSRPGHGQRALTS